MRLETWVRRSLPEIEHIIHPWLTVDSIVLLHGPRGVSKTNIGMAIALDVANGGGGFFNVTRPYKVLYVDGEMQRSLVKDRLLKFLKHTPRPRALQNLEYLNYADIEDSPGERHVGGFGDLARNDSYGRTLILQEIGYLRESEKEPVLLILDNKSCLMSTPDDNAATPQLHEFMLWLRELRAQNVTTILIHHDGKQTGRQNGTSLIERAPDTIISVTPNGTPAEGSIPTKWFFSKARSFTPGKKGSFYVTIRYDDDLELGWLEEGEPVTTIGDLDDWKTAVREIWQANPEMSGRSIAQELHLPKTKVCAFVAELKELSGLSGAGHSPDTKTLVRP